MRAESRSTRWTRLVNDYPGQKPRRRSSDNCKVRGLAHFGGAEGEHDVVLGHARLEQFRATPCSVPSRWIQTLPPLMSRWTKEP